LYVSSLHVAAAGGSPPEGAGVGEGCGGVPAGSELLEQASRNKLQAIQGRARMAVLFR
jgi:hypothetical protein